MIKIQTDGMPDMSARYALTHDGRYLIGKVGQAFSIFDLSLVEYPAGRIKLVSWEASIFGSLGNRDGLTVVKSDDLAFVSDETDPDPNVTVIDMHTGSPVKTLTGFTSPPSSLALSDNGEFIMIGGNGRIISQWSLKSLSFTGGRVKVNTGEFNILGYREDDDLLILNHSFGVYETYGVKRGKRIGDFRRSDAVPEKFIAFISGGNEILSKSYNELCVFSLGGTIIKRLQGHTDIISGYDANTACGLAATSQWTGTRDIFVWYLDRGDLIGRLSGHSGEVRAIAITHDAGYIVSGGADKTVRLWDTASGMLLDAITLDRPIIRLTPIQSNGLFYAVLEGSDAVLARLDGI